MNELSAVVFTKKLQNVLKIILGVVLFSFIMIVFAQTLGRVVKASIFWSEEASRFLFVWLILLGANIGILDGSAIRIDAIEHILPKKACLVVDIIMAIVALVAMGIMLYGGILYTQSIGANEFTPTMHIPRHIVTYCVPIGYAFNVWAQALYIVEDVRKLTAKEAE